MNAHAIGVRAAPSTSAGSPVILTTQAILAGPPALPTTDATVAFGGDLQSMMYEATIATRTAQEKAAEGTVHGADATRDQEMRAAKQAEDRAQEAASSSSFWGDFVKIASTVATVAGAAALCASAVMSGGATAPVVIALLGTLLTTGSGAIAKATGNDDLGKVCM